MNDHVAYELKEPLLVVKGLKKDLGGKTILGGIDFTIQDAIRSDRVTQGQVWGILGPSGMGKTTLFQCIAGLEKPTAGKILIAEPSVVSGESLPAAKLLPVRVGMVGVVDQYSTLFKWRRVISLLTKAACLRHSRSKKEAQELALNALAQYGLADKAHSYPAELSGGQRQRVAIIAQILSSNGLLLMDEPFTGLDPLTKDVACNAILRASHINDRSTTIVVTHDIASAVQICDTIILLGRKRDEAGNSLGAVIRQTYDLIEAGLAWHEGIDQTPEFMEMCRMIKNDFRLC